MMVALEVLYPTHFTLVYGEDRHIGDTGDRDHGCVEGDAGGETEGGTGGGTGGPVSIGGANVDAGLSEAPSHRNGAGHSRGESNHHGGGGSAGGEGGHGQDHTQMTPLEVWVLMLLRLYVIMSHRLIQSALIPPWQVWPLDRNVQDFHRVGMCIIVFWNEDQPV